MNRDQLDALIARTMALFRASGFDQDVVECWDTGYLVVTGIAWLVTFGSTFVRSEAALEGEGR